MSIPETLDGWPCRHLRADDPPPRLHAFLYRILRDGAASPGDVEQHALVVADNGTDTQFTNGHLDEYARSLISFFLDEMGAEVSPTGRVKPYRIEWRPHLNARWTLLGEDVSRPDADGRAYAALEKHKGQVRVVHCETVAVVGVGANA